MALQILATDSIGFGIRADLATADDAFVSQSTTVGSTDDTAINGTGSFHTVQVAGNVFGQPTGIGLGDDLTFDSGQQIVIEAGASVGSIDDGAIEVKSHDSAVVNDGTVSGEYGIVMGGIGTGQSTVSNSGLITGRLDAILRAFGSTETLLVTNHGQIISGGYGIDRFALDSNDANAIEIVRNRGSIIGDVDLGLGDDIYDGRGGTIEGTVFGGDGADTFFAGEGVEVFDGGFGIDTLDMRTSTGGRIDLSGAGTGTGLSRGDIYAGIENVQGSTSAVDTMIGSAAANTFYGFGGADVLRGGGGADVLDGGVGADNLGGGLGNDAFRFRSLADVGDTISDFSGVAGNNDLLRISAAAFGGGLVAGGLAASQFRSRADNLAQDADDRFIFRTTDRTLWFDADGTGTEAALMVADLQAGAVVTAADILLI